MDDHNNYVLWERYVEVLRRALSPEEFEKYVVIMTRFPPADFEKLFDLLGSPKDAAALHAAVDELVRRDAYWRRTRQNVVTLVKALSGVGGLILLGGALLKMFSGGG